MANYEIVEFMSHSQILKENETLIFSVIVLIKS